MPRSASPSAITVRDLNQEQREHIFEPFYTTKTKGTGLGMAIAQRIVEAHGGHITAGEDSPSGADIVVTLPYVPAALVPDTATASTGICALDGLDWVGPCIGPVKLVR